MQKLHLVGFTTDQDGLILSARRGARSGGYTLVLDDALAQAVEELRAREEEAAEAEGRSIRSDRTESRLPVSEIQARLRRGRSLKEVAKEAGVDPEWVERFAAPVFAEQAEVITRVQAGHLRRARLGPSAVRIGDAVRRNLIERDVMLSPDEIAQAWTTHQRPDGRWVVRFSFPYRGRSRTLRFEVKPSGDISAGDAFTSQLAYIAPTQRRAAPRPKPAPSAPDLSSKRSIVSTGYRADSPAKAVSRPAKERERAAIAMQKAAGRRAIEAERAAARKAREREQALARREREARVEAQRRAKEAADRAREAAAKVRLEQAEQVERDKTAAAAAAARQAEREAARRAARLKVKVAAKAVAAKKQTARAAPSPAKPPAAKAAPTPTKPAAPPPATSSSAVRPRPADTGSRAAPTRPASTAARSTAGAARPPRPTSPAGAADRPRPTGRPSPDERVAAAPPPRRGTTAAAGPPARRSTPRPTAVPSPRPSPSPVGRRPSADRPTGEVRKPLFRAGLADPADAPATRQMPVVRPAGEAPRPAPGPARRPAASTNGDTAGEVTQVARSRPPGQRRTRPLRAT